MEREEIQNILQTHNEWRRDNSGECLPVSPKKLGIAIDEAIKALKIDITKPETIPYGHVIEHYRLSMWERVKVDGKILNDIASLPPELIKRKYRLIEKR